MKRSVLICALIASAMAAPVYAKPAAKAGPPAQVPNHPQITMKQAIAKALAVRPGKVVAKELEKEAGGTGLRYSFDIVSGGITYEVGVDARTGAILENAKEGKNPD